MLGLLGGEGGTRRTLEKIGNATLQEDRKAALVELKERAEKDPIGVASMSMGLLTSLIPKVRDDVDEVRAILDTMLACLSPEASVHGEEKCKESLSTNSKLYPQDVISQLLELLEERDWNARFSILRILHVLQEVHPAVVQQGTLSSPQGLARLMDVLSDEREIVRNEALLVLVALTEGSQELTKIMAFEGAFDVLFRVVKEEDFGSVIAADSIEIVNNLLHANPSNANFFKEMSCVAEHVVPLLRKGIEFGSTGRTSNTRCLFDQMLDVLGNLLTATSDLQSMQTHLGKSGVLGIVVEGALHPSMGYESRGKALRLTSLLVWKHSPNRLLLSQLLCPGKSGSVLSALLKLCLELHPEEGDKSVHLLNASAVQVFKCYLSGNVDGQQHFAASLMPQPPMDDQEPQEEQQLGRVVMAALLGSSPEGGGGGDVRTTRVWGAAHVLMSVLLGNSVCQEIAAATPLELPMSSAPPDYFLQSLLQES
ncbi:hypothetical protein GUITHDRAFT_147436 [Guillardia theta CCMP2712]|uniref:Uncharacterized protein n=1 Tax=Guillardia theta (strain CCMP2712) TaxID=905079 RepID=L1ID08_GUITC|nr:hypothetical protein GUITHDRAFT_147436 [Guillardia theta CCMP2712]EKX34128.1 hypothetical protein GUITHDRAFT_147436 [Guillardia theta CCMP2712]|eukprot:XP_005821108.1 hypothetical protein GUITHDRAFT_147436 [Guillardia theta CCMP2712]